MSIPSDPAAGDTDGLIPENWSKHTGPANWFTFRCPPGCRVRQNESVLEIDERPASESPVPLVRTQSAEGRVPADEQSAVRTSLTLVICATWIGEDVGSAEAVVPDATQLFPDVICSDCPVDSLRGDGFQKRVGWSRGPAGAGFWRRWLMPRQRYQWQFWVHVQAPLLILASIQSMPGQPLDRKFARTCDQIMRSLQRSSKPAWPPDVFRRRVLALAGQHYPLLKASVSGSFSVRIEESEIHLANCYRVYLLQPEEFRRIVLPALTAVVRLQELGPDQMMPPLEVIRNRILPMLSPDEEPQSEGLVRVPWVGGLCVSYVLDEQDSYRFIHESMMEQWQLQPEGLHALALQNLRLYSAEHPLEVTVVGEECDPSLLMPVKADAYNCVRLLDPVFHRRLRELFGPEVLVGLPNRDFFVAVSLQQPALIAQVQERVCRDYATMHYPLTHRLLVISADGVSEYC